MCQHCVRTVSKEKLKEYGYNKKSELPKRSQFPTISVYSYIERYFVAVFSFCCFRWIIGGSGSQGIALWLACHELEPSTTKDPPFSLPWVGCGSLVVKVMDSWLMCQEFESGTTEEILRVGERCTLNMLRAQTSSRWYGVVVRRRGASSGVVLIT
ncbi:hypothetical protein TNCV_1568931 [Trichonephila clavipes]|nr:hypothetical protein TNCV_1568931 [Trichonephila clavipes]